MPSVAVIVMWKEKLFWMILLRYYCSVPFKKFYLFLAVLGLHCCADFSLVAARGGYSLVVRGLLTAAASLEEHRL